jgi:FkbM family methyltransferase
MLRARGADGGAARRLASPPGSQVTTDELLREVDEYFALGATVDPGDTVLDVGANVGAFSLRVAERCHSDVSLHCFEPSPHTFRSLHDNFETNPLLRKTRHAIHAIGLTSSEHAGQELSFYNLRRFPTNSTFDLAGKRREFEIFFEDRGRRLREKLGPMGAPLACLVSSLPKGRVGWWASRQIMGLEETSSRLETLDEMIARQKIARVDLLKIDVEGPELDVLRGLGAKSWPMVKEVVMETHNRDGRQTVIEALLRANGLTDIRTALQSTIDNGLESIVVLARRPN